MLPHIFTISQQWAKSFFTVMSGGFWECRWETTTSVLRVMTSKSQRMERKTLIKEIILLTAI
jgi:hypothetical protein